MNRKILLYIVYGDKQVYYNGAKYGLLTFMNWIASDDNVEPVVLTERPEEFLNYPVKTITMSRKQIDSWSLDGQYHFRIKNRGMAFAMDELNLDKSDKLLFFDTDAFFYKSPLALYSLIKSNQAVFYRNEGLIYKHKRFNVYIEHLKKKEIEIDNTTYTLNHDASMWGSAIIGIMSNMRSSLDLADKLMLEFFKTVPAHTIEPFSLVESLKINKCNLVEGKKFVKLYSTSGRKKYASKVLSKFFTDNADKPISDQISLAQNIDVRRPIITTIKERIVKELPIFFKK